MNELLYDTIYMHAVDFSFTYNSQDEFSSQTEEKEESDEQIWRYEGLT